MASRKKKKLPQRAIKQQLGDQFILISRLHLHLSNPRHEPVQSEAQAIAKLCDTELIAELAQDIAQRGSLSPLEVMGVIPMAGHPGHFISLEGNRRTCALIVANDPSRAPESIRQHLHRITANTSLPKKVKAHVFADEAQAKQWIELRHLGLQGGAGAKEWDATQKFRAAGGNTKTSARDNTLAVLVLDRLVSCGLLSAEQRGKINVTTITRYLGTPGVRAILGLGSNRELIYTHKPDEVDKALLKLVLDSLIPADDGSHLVNSRSNSLQRVQYANEIKSQGYAPSSSLETPEEPPAPTKPRTQTETARNASIKKRSANHPDTRKRLIPTDFAISINDPILLRLRREGLDLEIERFTFSANYILRALVEQIMTLFAKKKGRFNSNMTDNALTQVCADELRKLGITGKALTNVEKAAGAQNTGHSLHSLGHAVHGGTIPTANDLKKHFDTWRPALEAMLSAIGPKS